LAAATPVPAPALAFLCSHILECLLKAYLSRDGSDARLKDDSKLRHDLNALWELAFVEGLPIEKSPPTWVNTLSNLHKSPYYLRYSTGVHGIVTPGAEPMTSELAALVELAGQQLR